MTSNPALETLMLAFEGEDSLKFPHRALFLGAEPHPKLQQWPDLLGWQPLKSLANAWEAAGFRRADKIGDEKWPMVLILPGKSKDETLGWFAMAKNHLKPGGRILVAMPNAAGAGRFEKELSLAAGGISSIQKNKARAFHATLDHADEAIFARWSRLNESTTIHGTHYLTRAGIFSSQHIDPGSALLAAHFPAHLRGEIADLGAGWGYLSDKLLARCPGITRLDLYEADARAVECSQVNLTEYAARPEGLIRFFWHDVTQGIPEQYDAIIMNPPFHSGQQTNVDLGRAFLREAGNSLKRGGKLLLVANRQLPYEAVLESGGYSWRKIVEDKIYKVIFAEKR